MQSLPLNRFWHRRICEATMFVSLAIIGLYFLPYVQFPGIDSSALLLGIQSLAISATCFIIAFILYLWNPSKHIVLYSYAVYTLLTVSSATLALNTGGLYSPFIALWIVVSVFAGVFGWMGYGLITSLGVGFLIMNLLADKTPGYLLLSVVAITGPLLLSFIIWHSKKLGTHEENPYARLANELSHESNKSDVVIQAISDGVVAINSKGVIQLINPAAQKIIGWGKDDALKLSYKSVIKLMDKADKPLTIANDPVESVLANNQQVHSEDFSIMTESGKKVLISLIVSPIGQPGSGAIMVFRDMTKERAEEQEQAEFISTASHEMRTPVASIEGYLGLVLNPATAQIDDKARDYVSKAQASAQHLGRLFQDLLDVSKTEDGRMTNTPTVVNVSEFVANVAEGLEPQALRKGLRFIFKPKMNEDSVSERQLDPVYYAHVDADHLRELVSNLIENAIKYTPAGDILVDISGDQTHATISIQDSGIGIPAEDISHLFQKFYRVDNSDTREIGGTGLGLYLSRRLAEMMGGKIRVESEYKKGSTFFIDLPRLEAADAQRLIDTSTAAVLEVSGRQPLPVVDEPFGDPITPKDSGPVMTHIAAPEPTDSESQQVQFNTANHQSTQAPVNTPLSAIEQNPGAYIRQPAVQIPDRRVDQTNQP